MYQNHSFQLAFQCRHCRAGFSIKYQKSESRGSGGFLYLLEDLCTGANSKDSYILKKEGRACQVGEEGVKGAPWVLLGQPFTQTQVLPQHLVFQPTGSSRTKAFQMMGDQDWVMVGKEITPHFIQSFFFKFPAYS